MAPSIFSRGRTESHQSAGPYFVMPKTEYDDLKSEIRMAKTVNQELLNENLDLKSRNRGLEFEIGELEILKRENQKLKSENQKLKSENQKLENQIPKIEIGILKTGAETPMGRNRLKELNEEKSKLRRQLEALDEDIDLIEAAKNVVRGMPNLEGIYRQACKDLFRVRGERHETRKKIEAVEVKQRAVRELLV